MTIILDMRNRIRIKILSFYSEHNFSLMSIISC